MLSMRICNKENLAILEIRAVPLELLDLDAGRFDLRYFNEFGRCMQQTDFAGLETFDQPPRATSLRLADI